MNDRYYEEPRSCATYGAPAAKGYDSARPFAGGRSFTGGVNSGHSGLGAYDKVTPQQRTQFLAEAAAAALRVKRPNIDADTIKREAGNIRAHFQKDGRHFRTVDNSGFNSHVADYSNRDSAKRKADNYAKRLAEKHPDYTSDRLARELYADRAARRNLIDALRGIDGPEAKARALQRLREGKVPEGFKTLRSRKGKGRRGNRTNNNQGASQEESISKTNNKKKSGTKRKSGPKDLGSVRFKDRVARQWSADDQPPKKLSLFRTLAQRALYNYPSIGSHVCPLTLKHINLDTASNKITMSGVNYESRFQASSSFLSGIYTHLKNASSALSFFELGSLHKILTHSGVKENFEKFVLSTIDAKMKKISPIGVCALKKAGIADVDLDAFKAVHFQNTNAWLLNKEFSFQYKYYVLTELCTAASFKTMYAFHRQFLVTSKEYNEWNHKDKEVAMDEVIKLQLTSNIVQKCVELFHVVYGMLADILTVVHHPYKKNLLDNFMLVYIEIWNSSSDASLQKRAEDINKVLGQLVGAVTFTAETSAENAAAHARFPAILTEPIQGCGNVTVLNLLSAEDLGNKFPNAMKAAMVKLEEVLVMKKYRNSPKIERLPYSMSEVQRPALSEAHKHAASILLPEAQVSEQKANITQLSLKYVIKKLFPTVTDKSAYDYKNQYLASVSRALHDIEYAFSSKTFGQPKTFEEWDRFSVWNKNGFTVWPIVGPDFSHRLSFKSDMLSNMAEKYGIIVRAGQDSNWTMDGWDFHFANFTGEIVSMALLADSPLKDPDAKKDPSTTYQELAKNRAFTGKVLTKSGKAVANQSELFNFSREGAESNESQAMDAEMNGSLQVNVRTKPAQKRGHEDASAPDSSLALRRQIQNGDSNGVMYGSGVGSDSMPLHLEGDMHPGVSSDKGAVVDDDDEDA